MSLEEHIERILNEKICPTLKVHGGQVTLMEYREGIAYVKLSGVCAGCPSANLGTKQFIEETLCSELAEVKKVELSQTVSADLLAFARSILN